MSEDNIAVQALKRAREYAVESARCARAEAERLEIALDDAHDMEAKLESYVDAYDTAILYLES